MSVIDKILDKHNLKYEELTEDERATLTTWTNQIGQNRVTTETIRGHILKMKQSVEMELSKENMKRPSFWGFLFGFRRDYGLKARLRNYMLLEVFLTSPKKAKEELDKAVSSLASGINKK